MVNLWVETLRVSRQGLESRGGERENKTTEALYCSLEDGLPDTGSGTNPWRLPANSFRDGKQSGWCRRAWCGRAIHRLKRCRPGRANLGATSDAVLASLNAQNFRPSEFAWRLIEAGFHKYTHICRANKILGSRYSFSTQEHTLNEQQIRVVHRRVNCLWLGACGSSEIWAYTRVSTLLP